MDTFGGVWLVLAFSAFLIALFLIAPLLVGVFMLRVLRRDVSAEREYFEVQEMSKLGDIATAQAKIARQLEDLVKG